jgi:hypothetical protein
VKPGSENNKKEEGKNSCLTLFAAINFTKIVNYLMFRKGTEKDLSKLTQRIYGTVCIFNPKTVNKLSENSLDPEKLIPA